jgi:hypothetical protein
MNLPPPTLQQLTNHAHIDALLPGLVELCELTFPERIRAYYLVGSYADGSAVPSSDLDLFIIFGGELHERERATINQLIESCCLIGPVRLDLNVASEQHLRAGVPGARKVAKLLYGAPILDALPLAPRDQHLQRSLRNAFHTSYLLRQRAENLVFPLTYPDPAGDFYGYERWGMYLGARAFGPGVRTLLSAATSMATALVLLETDYPYVGSKAQSVQAYQEYIGDEWSSFLHDLYAACKMQWHYQVPDATADRAHLLQLCTLMLAFENAFLYRCRRQILSLVTHGDLQARRIGVACLQRIMYPGADFVQALHAFVDEEDSDLQQAAEALAGKVSALSVAKS